MAQSSQVYFWNTLTEVMDICRPPLQWIDGRCYRRQEEVEYTVEAGYTGEELDDEGGDEEGLQHEIVEVPGGKYRASLQIAEPFYGSIIGKGGDNRRRLEAETKTKVQVPKKGQQGEVIVEGRSRSGVATAASRFGEATICREAKYRIYDNDQVGRDSCLRSRSSAFHSFPLYSSQQPSFARGVPQFSRRGAPALILFEPFK